MEGTLVFANGSESKIWNDDITQSPKRKETSSTRYIMSMLEHKMDLFLG
jgi:hypothetical protein